MIELWQICLAIYFAVFAVLMYVITADSIPPKKKIGLNAKESPSLTRGELIFWFTIPPLWIFYAILVIVGIVWYKLFAKPVYTPIHCS